MTLNKRRVLIYRTDLLPISETFIAAQASALRAFEPRFIGLCRAVRSLDVPRDSILLTGEPSVAGRIRKRLYWSTWVAPLFHRRAASVKADLLHAHFAPDALTATHLAETLNLPLIVTLHGYDVTIPRNSPTTYAKLWKRASLFLCVSEFIRQKALEVGFPAEKLRVHHIGVDVSQFQPSGQIPAADTVLFVSRMVEKKGCEFLLRAMALVQKERPSAQLTVIGDGPLRAQMEQLASTLGINARFLGAQPNSVVRSTLQVSRVFCVPSITARNGDSEGFGMVFAEAQAMGVPVVSFAHGGIPEVVRHGETGFLARERDTEHLAEGLMHYLGDDQSWQRASRRGVEWVREQFDIVKQTMELEQVYAEVIAAAQRRTA